MISNRATVLYVVASHTATEKCKIATVLISQEIKSKSTSV